MKMWSLMIRRKMQAEVDRIIAEERRSATNGTDDAHADDRPPAQSEPSTERLLAGLGGPCPAGGAFALVARGTNVVEAPMISAEASAIAIASARGPSAVIPTSTARPALPFSRGDHLVGHYFGNQGRTALTLVVEEIDGNDVNVKFDFAGGRGFNAATGRFRMHGSYNPSNRHLHLEHEGWIDEPDVRTVGATYEMVGLLGTVSKTGSYSGTIPGGQRLQCTTFAVSPDTSGSRPGK